MHEMRITPGRVLVTGGAGFIGSHTVDQLLEKGLRVRVLDNLSTGDLTNLPLEHPLLEIQSGDVLDQCDVQRAMVDVSHCLHLAAQVSVEASFRAPQASANNNIIGFINVLQAARKAGVERLVYASSAAVYGNPGQLPISEAAPVVPISPYGIEKSTNEAYAKLYKESHGLSCLGLRYFNVYGPRQNMNSSYSGVISIFMNKVRDGEPIRMFGDGEQTRDFIYVRDVARCNVLALGTGEIGVCNVGCGTSVSLNQLLDTISSFASIPTVRFLPSRQGDIRHSRADVARMQSLFGMIKKTPISEGLTQLWRADVRACGRGAI